MKVTSPLQCILGAGERTACMLISPSLPLPVEADTPELLIPCTYHLHGPLELSLYAIELSGGLLSSSDCAT